jgi:hypothetical protein
MREKDDFIFPFSTCEKPNKSGLAQPYSVFVNLLSIIIILYFLFKTKNIYSFLVILSLLAFECVHSFSHAIHLPSYIQNNITHFIAYSINIFFLLTLYNYTHKVPNILFCIFLIIVTIIDIYSFMNLSFIYYFSSSMIIFFSILIYYYRFIPKNKKKYILIIVLLGALIILLFYNEKVNCKKMLEMFPNIPFHAFLELNGTFIFYFICKFFSSL